MPPLLVGKDQKEEEVASVVVPPLLVGKDQKEEEVASVVVPPPSQ